ncbi:isovaleryl-CoA dehydrogenase, mitochondrial-like [Phragmites australis]|uniref:isovaleryl-CoA dehydrogenase, mitochondrial-like n=1 Tax=Phragmites australis TaxID=29695 RepID=UPI002D78A79C|nr:isovaleryl-CoA dehydrogenase, mitochondrial-like [Phragmites australis]
MRDESPSPFDASNHFPKEVNLWRLMGDFSLHDFTAPEEYEGMGLHRHGGDQQGLRLRRPPLRRPFQPLHQPAGPSWQPCTKAQVFTQADVLSQIVNILISGEHVRALAMSEPNCKCYFGCCCCTVRSQFSATFFVLIPSDESRNVVYAKTDLAAGSKGITAFIIEKGMSG